jgi:hypothetical protein
MGAVMTIEELWTCEGCEEQGIIQDEIVEYYLPVGLLRLCLECGPEENYDNLRR